MISNSNKWFPALDILLHQTHFWPMFIVKNVEIIYIFYLYFSKKNLKGKILSYFENIFFHLQTSQKTRSELWANFNNFDLQKWPNEAWEFMISRSIFVSIPMNIILYIVIKWRTIWVWTSHLYYIILLHNQCDDSLRYISKLSRSHGVS